MFFRTVWYLMIICFVIYNLISLVSNKFVTTIDYKRDILKEDYLSICLRIESSKFKCEDIGDNQNRIDVCNSLQSLFRHIENETEFKSPYSITKKAEDLNIASYFKFESNSSRAFLKEYYLNQNYLCIFYLLKFEELKEHDPDSYHTVRVHNLYELQYLVHFHDSSLPRSVGYHENVKCINFKKCKNLEAKATQYKYQYLPPPYDTKCQDYSVSKFPINNTEKIEGKQSCLQECLKRKLRSSFFLYSKKDKEKYALNDFNDLDQINSSYVAYCESVCPRQTCFITYHYFYRLKYAEDNHLSLLISSMYYKCMNKSRMEHFDFYLQFFGFVSLTFGLNFLSFFYKIINKLNTLASGLFADRKDFFDLFENFLLLCFYVISIITTKIHFSLYMYNNLSDISIPSTSVDPNNLTVALCKEISEDLRNLTLYEIDKRSFAYEEISQWPVFKFEEDERLVDSKLRVFYYQYETVISKCFTFDLFIHELRYRTLLSNTHVLINVTNFQYIFLTEFKKNFDKSFPELHLNFKLKMIETQRIANCKNYEIKNDGCTSMQSCRDICYLNAYTSSKDNILPAYHVIYRDHFNSERRKKLRFDLHNAYVDDEALEKCNERYKLEDCKSIKVDKNEVPLYEVPKSIKATNENISLNLYFTKHIHGKRITQNRFDFALDLLTLASILIGINLPLFLSFTFRKLSVRFRRLSVLEDYLFLFYVIGFFWHFRTILVDTFYSHAHVDYTYRFNYLQSNRQLPNFVFCIKINATVAKNRRLTGDILDKQFEHINFSYIFNEIVYYDWNFKKKVWLSNSSDTQTRFKVIDTNIKLNYFFFLSFKCFELFYRLNYDSHKNSLVNNILKIRLNKDHRTKLVFNLKHNGTDNFNDYVDIYPHFSYKINLEHYYISSYDMYQIVLNPLLLFFKGYPVNDASFIKTVKNEFQKNVNLSTRRLSLHYDDFKYTLEDSYFEMFNLQYIKKQAKRGLIDTNFKRHSYGTTVYYLDSAFHKTSTIYVNKVFFFNSITYKNKTDFYSLFLKGINCLSFWANFNLLNAIDLLLDWSWLSKFKRLFILKHLIQFVSTKIKKLKSKIIYKFRNKTIVTALNRRQIAQ